MTLNEAKLINALANYDVKRAQGLLILLLAKKINLLA